MRFARIRWRLAAWNMLVLALVLGVTLGVAALGEIRAYDRALDGELALVATRIATRVQRQHRERTERRHHDAHEDGEHEQDDRDGADSDDRERDDERVVDEGGGPSAWLAREVPPDVIAFVARPGARVESSRFPVAQGLPDRVGLAAALRGETRTTELAVGGEPLRLTSMPILVEDHIVGAAQVGKPIREDREALARSLFILLATGAAGLVASLAGSVFLAARAMRPIAEAFDRQQQFLADASHELRTPTAVVRARAELLAREADTLPAAAREEVGQLQRDADELAELLDDLLDLTRLDAGQTVLALEPVAVADVVEDLGAQLAPLAESRDVQLTAQTTPVWAKADTTRVRQVLRALADNALKHTPAGGHVRIEVDRSGPWSRVRITDDGEGIAEEHLPRVFDRFYRADQARSREARATRGGTGLGLAIASQLVRAMHGEVSLESSPGRGTVATVLLPLASQGG